jgi:hypothetical protein
MDLPTSTPLRIPNQLFKAEKFEVWSKGQKIDEGSESLELWVEQISTESLDKSLQITIRKSDRTVGNIHKHIYQRFYLDVAYALQDRIVVCIIPENSNITKNDTYSGFVSFAPFKTRAYYEFEKLEPFCCSLFYDENDKLCKVTYSNAMNRTNIICT